MYNQSLLRALLLYTIIRSETIRFEGREEEKIPLIILTLSVRTRSKSHWSATVESKTCAYDTLLEGNHANIATPVPMLSDRVDEGRTKVGSRLGLRKLG